jgi:5-methyltetrahydropteroyltriglutamate--homocysteine methyltransferase
VEEPSIHWRAADGNDPGYVSFLVDCLNREIAGLDDVEVWVHTCWGNPAMQRSHENTDYAASVELFMERANFDVWTIESKDRGHSPLPLFERYRGGFPDKKVAVGMVSHRTVQVESVDEIVRDVRQAMRFIPAENLILSSDCGFGRQGLSRLVAFHKAEALAQAAAIVRAELP